MLGQRVRRRTHCALRAPFKQLRQVSARSACVLRHTHAPPALRFSARAEGNPKTDIHKGHCFAALRSAPSRGRKRRALRKLGRAQRWPEWMSGCLDVRLPHPCWLRLRRGGCGVGMGVEAPMLRELTRRGCPSGARSAKRVPRRTPQPTRRRFAPSHSEGVADWGSPFFWVLFFGEAKKSTSPAGATPGLRPQQRHAPNQRTQQNTTKSIATSTYPTIASSQ